VSSSLLVRACSALLISGPEPSLYGFLENSCSRKAVIYPPAALVSQTPRGEVVYKIAVVAPSLTGLTLFAFFYSKTNNAYLT
jgi:hypothetical protein